MTIETDEKLQLAKNLWDKLSEDSKEEIKKYIINNKPDYYMGAFDHLSQVYKALEISKEEAYKVCSQLITLSYLVINHKDLNLLEDRKYVN